MNEVPSPQLRISDQERESALQALGEHMTVGRIDIDEYGERSARITAAKTRGELVTVFEDLPQPHPAFDGQPSAPAKVAETAPQPAVSTEPGAPAQWMDRPVQQRLAAALVPLMWIAGIALFFTVGGWWWFLLPVAFTGVGRAMWGQEWHDQQPGHGHRDRDRDRRRDLRDDRRDRDRRELGR